MPPAVFHAAASPYQYCSWRYATRSVTALACPASSIWSAEYSSEHYRFAAMLIQGCKIMSMPGAQRLLSAHDAVLPGVVAQHIII